VLPAFATLSVRIAPPSASRAADEGPGGRTPSEVEPAPRAPRDRVTVSDAARGGRARRAASPPAGPQHRDLAVADRTPRSDEAPARARAAAAAYGAWGAPAHA
jgi:hypothetical protein